MHTLGDMAKTLNRSPLILTHLQKRFELPVSNGASYADAYLCLLRTLVALRSLNISEEALRDLWCLEKKLLQLLHVDSTGSPTWFLDSCGATTHLKRRLLLTSHDLGIPLETGAVQPGLNFANGPAELFAGAEMGEDALRVLRDCIKLRDRILKDISAELPNIRAAIKWAGLLS